MTGPHPTRQQINREPILNPDQVEMLMVGDGRWRVLDNRLAVDDVRALLGFVEQQEAGLDVTFMAHPGSTRHCTSLDEARRLFAPHNAIAGETSWADLARNRHAL